MLVLKIVFWSLMVLLVYCFMCCVTNASSGTDPRNKIADIVVGVVICALTIVIAKYFGGYVL